MRHGNAGCKFGCESPRVPRDIFDEMTRRPLLASLPMHRARSGRDHFEKYEALKFEVTNDAHMPSLSPPKAPTKESKLLDKANNSASRQWRFRFPLVFESG